jgi:CAP12/Pycsar effector protein, TIR domain
MSRTDSAQTEPPKAVQPGRKRAYVKQSDIPGASLGEAQRIPTVIAEQFGKQPTAPASIALALDLLPKGSQFELLSYAAIAYGLSEGGSKSEVIGLTDLGTRVVAPLVEGDDVVAMREAFLRPRIIGEFLRRYNGSTLPSDERIGRNVLEDLGVPTKRTKEAFAMIVEGATQLGLVSDVRGKQVVSLQPVETARLRVVPEPPEPSVDVDAEETASIPTDMGEMPETPTGPEVLPVEERNRKVFVSHGSNRKIVEQLKGLLEFGEFEPVISVDRETTSKPVPEKVMDDMRDCGAGIIHVGVERMLLDSDGNEHRQLNSNVLIEIGAAMALYKDNFILLVEEGTKLPSNLQGLYEVRYEGKTLDADATMRLLKAFKAFKS